LRFEVTNQDDYIVAPEITGRSSLKKFISKAFTHYWRVAGLKRKVSFKNLRKDLRNSIDSRYWREGYVCQTQQMTRPLSSITPERKSFSNRPKM
jgi:hypothetical protein